MLVYCGQVVWITMKLGIQVGLGAGHIVLDKDPAPHPPKEQSSSPIFGHICRGQAGWIKMPLGMEVGFVPDDIVLDGDWGPSSPSPKRGQSPPFNL